MNSGSAQRLDYYHQRIKKLLIVLCSLLRTPDGTGRAVLYKCLTLTSRFGDDRALYSFLGYYLPWSYLEAVPVFYVYDSY